MIEPVFIRLSGEPKGKGRPRFVKQSGRAFTPSATRSYEAALRFAAQEAMARRIPGAELRVFDGGHLFVMQDRSAYPAIIEWLTRP